MLKKKQLPNISVTIDDVDPNIGLTTNQIEALQLDPNKNEVSDNNGKSYADIILGNILTFFNLLMFSVAVLELIFCGLNMATNTTFSFSIVSNILIGTIQECHSKKVLSKLKLQNETKVLVRRGGEDTAISNNEILKYESIILKAGDTVPADIIIRSIDGDDKIEVNESLLTGESTPVKKHVGDRILSGSYIISGKLLGTAEYVGIDTYLHSIEKEAKGYKKPKSKLMIALSRIIKILAAIAVPLAIIVFVNELVSSVNSGLTEIYFIWDELNSNDPNFMKQSVLYEPVRWMGMTMSYMIPSGMILLSSVTMATGVVSLSRKKALTNDLYSVEALSRVDTLCLDKTGTLTDGTMIVEKYHSLTGDYAIDNFEHIVSTYLSAFSNKNQTSIAMENKFGTNKYYNIIKKEEFSSDRKYSIVELENEGIFALGAPEFLITDEGILKQAREYANRGMRVLILVRARGHLKDDMKLPDKRKPIGIFIIRDNIRPEVPETMKWFRDNDVDIRVISGDNIGTVSYIAKQSGIKDWDKTFDMSTLKDNDDLDKIVMNTKIFGRVSPQQKSEIVTILKKHGRTVAMTGDGINDLSALKKADCSIALANGVPATKSVANIVLLDSNFENMKNAVLEGRRVINNIQRSSTLFIMKDILWFLIILIPLLFGIPHTIESTVMSIVNTFITGIGSTLLSFEPDRSRIRGDFIKTVLGRAIVAGVYMFLPIFGCYIMAFILTGMGRYPSIVSAMEPMIPTIALCVTVAGFIVFAVVCRPFTLYRKILYICILALVVLLLIAVPELFLKNGTEYLAELRAEFGNSVFGIVRGVLENIFSFRLYRDLLHDKTQWIYICVFFAISAPLYIITDRQVNRFLNKTIFNKHRFEDYDDKETA